MKTKYMMKQNRQLYQLFPESDGSVGYAIPIPGRYSLNDSVKVWDKYNDYYSQGKIPHIKDMIDNHFTYEDIIHKLDL